MRTTIAINPDILRWARETSNLSYEEAARKLGIKSEKFKDFESGEDKPTYNQLEDISTVFKRPLAIFFFPEPPKEIEIKTSFRTYPIEDVISLSSNIVFLLRQAQANILNLYELFDGSNPFKSNLDELFKSFTMFDKYSSNLTRSYFSISITDQKSWYGKYHAKVFECSLKIWRDAVEALGIFVFKAPFKNDNISGFCLYDKEFPVIYLNNQLSFSRQIFTLFHELCHILSRSNSIDKYGEEYLNNLINDDKNIEFFCHDFAASFLVPESDLKQQLKGIIINEEIINSLSHLYAVSKEVILRRLRSTNLIDYTIYIELINKWRDEDYRIKPKTKGGNTINNVLTYLSKSYLIAAYKKYYNNIINEYQLSNYVRLSINSLPEFENKLRQML